MRKYKIGNLLLVAVILLGGIYIYCGVRDRKEHLTIKQTYYTVGKIIGYEQGAKVSPSWVYEFYDGNEIREVSNFMDDNFSAKSKSDWEPYIDQKFFVKYSAIKPKYNEIYLDKPAPDSVIVCNKCKFEKLPSE